LPLDALQGDRGYNSPSAGPAPYVEHHIRALVAGKGAPMTLPRIDFWTFTTEHKNVKLAPA
ncbi:hypothetical protein BGZ83_003761, partial [Gryganskiella cystojenkinii]